MTDHALSVLASPLLYMLGTVLLMPGTVLLLPSFTTAADYRNAIGSLIAATSVLTVAAAIDMSRAVAGLPKDTDTDTLGQAGEVHAKRSAQPLPVDEGGGSGREQLLDRRSSAATPGAASRIARCFSHGLLRTPLRNPLFMLIGGVCFLIGSALYWPTWASDVASPLTCTVATVGTWVFRTGTTSYLCGSFDALPSALPAARLGQWRPFGCGGAEAGSGEELAQLWISRVVLGGIMNFVVGAVLYFTGGVLSQAGLDGFALTWVLGSVFFVVGAALFLAAATHSCAAAAAQSS
jgi:hypothetical protein